MAIQAKHNDRMEMKEVEERENRAKMMEREKE